jgi:hypothetical protein
VNGPLDVLLAADPWVEFVTRRDLLHVSPTRALRDRVAEDKRIGHLFEATDPWPPERPLTRAYDPKDAIWKVAVLADFGLDRGDPRVAALAERLFASMAPDGTFRHGGFDHTRTYDSRGYACVTHAVTGALALFGYGQDGRLAPAIEHIRRTQRLDGGWHPNAALQPGAPREMEPSCPFGTMHVLRAATNLGGETLDAVGSRAAEYLLDCWTRRDEPFRPVGFGMGSQFAKLSYPFATYGALSVVDALTAVPSVRGDGRLAALVGAVAAVGGDAGWMAGTVSRAWEAFDFGQKKTISPWVTLLMTRALRRMASQ